MPIPAPGSTLAAIETKVRRLTRSPSEAQLTTADLDNYINTFVVFDFPEQLRTFNLRTQFSFQCLPYQDVYPLSALGFGTPAAINADLNPWYDFHNKYLTVHPPVYIAGYNSFFTQSPEQLFAIYPQVRSIASIGYMGDAATTTFSGVINSQQAFIPNNLNQQVVLCKGDVLFSSVDLNNNGLAMIDIPVLDASTGNPTNIGILVPQNQPTNPLLLTPPYQANLPLPYQTNFVNYITGQFTVTFPFAPGSGQAINTQTLPLVPSLPQAFMIYDDEFVIRPVPDQPYTINFEVYPAPTWLMNSTDQPALNEYWQYIAYGAAKKIFEDRMDLDSVAQILPEFKTQERLCLRRTIVQYTNERTATIYTEQVDQIGYNNWWGGIGGPF